MTREQAASTIPGVSFGAVDRHVDARGSFRELWRAPKQPGSVGGAGSSDGPPTFVQANLSTSAPGVLRGLHLHRRQVDYWVVLSGRALVAVVDVRPMLSDPAGRPVVEMRELGADDWVVIPERVAHGFLALEPLELLYLVTNWYDGSDELGFAWDDPEVAVPWPRVSMTTNRRPILSERDSSNPPLAELVAALRVAS